MLSFWSNSFCIAMLLFVLITMQQQAIAQAPQSGSAQNSSAPSVLVLHNGQTLEGQISYEAGKYIVRLPSGSVIRIAGDRVNFTAQTLSEAYWELAARTRVSDTDQQVRVFQWCLRNELFSEAENHLLVLQESSITARRLVALDFDLKSKIQRATERKNLELKREQERIALARKKAEQVARQQRIEAMIGTRSVSIPNLHGVPLRPVHQRIAATENSLPTSQPQRLPRPVKQLAQQVDQNVTLDHLGNPVTDTLVVQTSFLEAVDQTLFSTPATASRGSRHSNDVAQPALPTGERLADDEATVTPEKEDQASKPNSSEAAQDPFDPAYFNQNFRSAVQR